MGWNAKMSNYKQNFCKNKTDWEDSVSQNINSSHYELDELLRLSSPGMFTSEFVLVRRIRSDTMRTYFNRAECIDGCCWKQKSSWVKKGDLSGDKRERVILDRTAGGSSWFGSVTSLCDANPLRKKTLTVYYYKSNERHKNNFYAILLMHVRLFLSKTMAWYLTVRST